MQRIFHRWSPDLVLRDPCEYASAVVATRTGARVAQVAISLAEVEAASIAVAEPALEEHHRGLTEALMATPYLTRFPRSLDPSPFSDTVRFREATTDQHEPLPDWWGNLDGPFVYMTFGTVLGYMADAARVYGTAVTAVEHLDVRVLMTVGRKFDSSVLSPLPKQVHVEPWVDQSRVLGHAELVVTHCGSGTALGSLAAGVPMVAVPLFADQFENSRRIADAGAALIVEGRRDKDAERRSLPSEHDGPALTAAIEALLRDREYRRNAMLIRTEMAAMPSIKEVIGQVSTPR
jgi:MGT family glycosyltransferase